MDEFKSHRTQGGTGQCAPVFRVQAGGLHKLHPSGFQCSDRLTHFGNTQANALQALGAVVRIHPGLGLNQLPQKAATRAFHEFAFGQDAKALFIGYGTEIEHVFVIRLPIGAAGCTDVLHHTKLTHPRKRRRVRVDGRNGFEVNVVD